MASKVSLAGAPAPRAGDGILVDPPQTTDDVVEKVDEMPPAFTLLASRATTESNFDKLELKVFSFAWAVPHLLATAENEWSDDPRGAIVELIRTGVSFRNISNEEITIHANTPVAKQHTPSVIYARLSGFYVKGKKGAKSDDVRLKPGQTATYKIHWKNLPNEYTPVSTVSDSRVWNNLLTFCVEIKNINDSTGAAIASLASVVSMIPKVHYTKRKSNPAPPVGYTLKIQGTDNFQLHALTGADDLYAVDAVPAQVLNTAVLTSDVDRRNASAEIVLDDNTSYIFDAMIEGDLIGTQRVQARRGTKVYNTIGLVVKKIGGNDRPLEISTRQGIGTRLIVPGMCTNVRGGCSYSYFKWDQGLGHWVLWDDYEQSPRAIDGDGSLLTPLTTRMPCFFLKGVYTVQEKEELIRVARETGRSVNGQPFGEPKGFGEVLRSAISVIVVVGKVPTSIGTLL